jgi:hypothetical protein
MNRSGLIFVFSKGCRIKRFHIQRAYQQSEVFPCCLGRGITIKILYMVFPNTFINYRYCSTIRNLFIYQQTKSNSSTKFANPPHQLFYYHVNTRKYNEKDTRDKIILRFNLPSHLGTAEHHIIHLSPKVEPSFLSVSQYSGLSWLRLPLVWLFL